MNWFCRGIAVFSVFALAIVSVVARADVPLPVVPRPEHPLPQMQRAEWLNLNGTWEFAETDDAKDTSWLSGKAYPD